MIVGRKHSLAMWTLTVVELNWTWLFRRTIGAKLWTHPALFPRANRVLKLSAFLEWNATAMPLLTLATDSSPPSWDVICGERQWSGCIARNMSCKKKRWHWTLWASFCGISSLMCYIQGDSLEKGLWLKLSSWYHERQWVAPGAHVFLYVSEAFLRALQQGLFYVRAANVDAKTVLLDRLVDVFKGVRRCWKHRHREGWYQPSRIGCTQDECSQNQRKTDNSRIRKNAKKSEKYQICKGCSTSFSCLWKWWIWYETDWPTKPGQTCCCCLEAEARRKPRSWWRPSLSRFWNQTAEPVPGSWNMAAVLAPGHSWTPGNTSRCSQYKGVASRWQIGFPNQSLRSFSAGQPSSLKLLHVHNSSVKQKRKSLIWICSSSSPCA